MRIQFITKQQDKEALAQEMKRLKIAADRMKFLGRLLQAVRDCRDYLGHAGAWDHENQYNIVPFRDLMADLNSLLDRDEDKDFRG
jgi:hypothetical protein